MDSSRTHLQSSEHMETRVSQFLGEFRIMVPGLAALLGFQLTSAYSDAWDRLPYRDQVLHYGAVLCTALSLVFVLVPGLYHRNMREIEENDRFLRFAAQYFGLGVLLLAVSLVITVFVQSNRVFQDERVSLAAAAVFAIVVLWLWVVIPGRRADRVRRDGGADQPGAQHRLPVTEGPRAGRQV